MPSIFTTASLETFTSTNKHGVTEYNVKVVVDDAEGFELAHYGSFTVAKFGKIIEFVVEKGFKRAKGQMTLSSDRGKRFRSKLVEPYFKFTQKRHFGVVYKDAVFKNISCEVFVDDVNGIKVRLAMPDLELHDTVQVKPKKKNKLNGIPASDARSKKIAAIVTQLIASGELTGVTYTDAKGHEYFISLDGLIDS